MEAYLHRVLTNLDFWGFVGVFGQMLFGSRFVVQWLVSERRKESTIPISFWYLSICGSLPTLAYGIAHAESPVMLMQVFGLVVYARNLMLIHAKRAAAGTAG